MHPLIINPSSILRPPNPLYLKLNQKLEIKKKKKKSPKKNYMYLLHMIARAYNEKKKIKQTTLDDTISQLTLEPKRGKKILKPCFVLFFL